MKNITPSQAAKAIFGLILIVVVAAVIYVEKYCAPRPKTIPHHTDLDTWIDSAYRAGIEEHSEIKKDSILWHSGGGIKAGPSFDNTDTAGFKDDAVGFRIGEIKVALKPENQNDPTFEGHDSSIIFKNNGHECFIFMIKGKFVGWRMGGQVFDNSEDQTDFFNALDNKLDSIKYNLKP